MYPPNFKPFDLFGQQPEIGLQPEDFFGLRAQQFDPSQMNVEMGQTPFDTGMQYKPEHQLTDQLMQALQEMPIRTKPGFGRRLLGATAGLAADNPKNAMEVSDYITNKPYYQRSEDYKRRIQPLEKGAELENRRNTNQRMGIYQSEGRRIQQQNADTSAKKQQATEENQKHRTDVYKFKAEHPDWKFVTQKGGNVFAINPLNPKMTLDTGINSGTLDEMDKMNLDLDNKLNVVRESGEQQRETVGARGVETRKNIGAQGNQTRQNIGAQGEEARKTKSTISPNVSKPGGDKTVTRTTKDAKGNITGTVITNTGFGNQAKTVKMKGPDGKIYDIPSDKVEDAKKNKMTVVQ